MDIGVFIPIGNNGWLISETSPQYMPSFGLNRAIVQKAEHYNLDFALSMIKLRGFGGRTEFWDHNLESFTLMAGLAAVTSRIKLYASVAVLTMPPAIVARMASTIDSIAPGRFGINLVTGWQKAEYDQMGLWPGEQHYIQRYEYLDEYVQVMKDLWETGRSDFQGQFFTMSDCRLSPRPSAPIKLVCAGQSDRGIRFAAEQADFSFVTGAGLNAPAACAATSQRLMSATAETGRAAGAYVLTMVIADETDEAAMSKWNRYKAGADKDALAWLTMQSGADTNASATSTAQHMILPASAVNFNMATFVGSYTSIARMLDELAAIPGIKGAMLTFDDFLIGMDQFGERIQPLMKTRGTA